MSAELKMRHKKVERFEDLIAWQKARELTKQVYDVTRKKPFSSDFGLREQIQKASVSIMSNLAEGFERGSSSEFHQFIVIAKDSCAEVRSQLYAALSAIKYFNFVIPACPESFFVSELLRRPIPDKRG